MKNLLLAISMALAVTLNISAQPGNLRYRTDEDEIPLDVVKSFNNDFAKATTREWSIISAVVVGEEYGVSGFDNYSGEKPTFYSVVFTENGLKEGAVYDHYARLVKSKKIIADIDLPEAVRKAIGVEYPDYTILKNQEVISSGKSGALHYRVTIQSGPATKVIGLDASGTMIK